jgi:hypothetical protein
MNVFKFLSATLLAGICLFSGCKKEKSIVPENPSVVEITVSNSQGELLGSETVRMYDETSYESFKKNHSTKPLLEITTDSNGMARFTLESNLWFQNTKSREFMFVVLKAFDTDNYQWWSKGGTVNAGKKHAFRIETTLPKAGTKELQEKVTTEEKEEKAETEKTPETENKTETENKAEETPQTENKTEPKEASETEETPMKEEAPAKETTTSKEETTDKEETPVKKDEETPVEEKAPEKQDTPAKEKEIIVTKKETPVKEEKAPVSEEIIPAIKEASPLQIENGVLLGLADRSITHLTLPAEVKSIAPQAFWESKLETIVLNEGLESIGIQAFARSRKLVSVSFPASLKIIGPHAFEDCESLQEVDLSQTNIQEISTNSFRETGLKKIIFPASLRKINSQAFLKTDLETIILPANLQEIGDEAFREIRSLKSATIPNNIQRIGYQAFQACTQLEEISYIGKALSAKGILEAGAFDSCQALQRITLPQSIRELGIGVFLECSSLKEIILPQSVRKIGNQGLRTNYPMESLVFEGEEAPELGNGSFPFTEDLVRITIPTGCMETYRNKWSDHPGYLKKIEERP